MYSIVPVLRLLLLSHFDSPAEPNLYDQSALVQTASPPQAAKARISIVSRIVTFKPKTDVVSL